MMINQLVLYRNLLDDSIIHDFNQLVRFSGESNISPEEYKSIYFGLCSSLVEYSTEFLLSIKDYLAIQILKSQNRFSSNAYNNRIVSTKLESVIRHDIKVLQLLFKADIHNICNNADDDECMLNNSEQELPVITKLIDSFANNNLSKIAHELKSIYGQYGSGIFIFNQAFRVNELGGIEEINTYNPQNFDTIFGYENNISRLLKNIESFMNNKFYHHVLLAGDNGTGKSSSVRALVPHFKNVGIKLIDIKKYQIRYITQLFESVADRQEKFIFFLDDLSFEDDESDYKLLKSIIEGSAESIPINVCFCVTTNRRHIIKEDRLDRENEIHLRDAINEKTSLADRFGLYLHYSEPTQNEYIDIVNAYCNFYSLNVSTEIILSKALQYSRQQGSRSCRVAKQFITSIQAELI